MKKVVIFLIVFYQKWLSFDHGLLAFLTPGGACKFTPTCSEYTKEMVDKNGVIKGLYLGGKRILSCH